ncbi:MAG: tRNA adenosine(34) deaminase TadA [Gammaproteobacteria bacterium]|nr:tRNA adenosine(34) deaminase TadA [Gammaproteobacteria bacterium]
MAHDVRTSIDEKWMHYALSLAKKAESIDEVPVGAVLVKGETVMGEGWNQAITQSDPTAHAEVVAIRQAAQSVKNYRLSGSVLYVTLEPCAMCVGAMIHARIERLVFAAREPKSGAIVSGFTLLDEQVFNHRMDVVEGVLAQDASDLLTNFFRKKRSRNK